MTREEAIDVLKERYLTCVGIGLDNHANRVNEAIDMAIEALSAEYEDYEHATLVDIKEPLKVAVVLCKDCRYAEDDITHMYCVYFGHKVYGDDYCNHGERQCNYFGERREK